MAEPVEGWSSIGVPSVQSVADTGGTGWLSVWHQGGRIIGRHTRTSAAGFPPIEESNDPPPFELSSQSPLVNQLVAARGNGGAWAVWLATEGIAAQWVSATTGRPQGDRLVLGPGPGGLLHAAGDGTTAWVCWETNSINGSLAGVTLGTENGPPRVTGSFSLEGLTRFAHSFAIAAHNGRALVVEIGLPDPNASFLTKTHVLNSSGAVVGGPHLLSGPAPAAGSNLYGVICQGSGWMLVWADLVTPILPNRVVYGRMLAPDGAVDPAFPLKALLVEPEGGQFVRRLASAEGTGIIVLPRAGLAEFTDIQAVIIAAGSPTKVVPLGVTQPVFNYGPLSLLAIGFDGSFITQLSPRGKWDVVPPQFAEELSLTDPTSQLGTRIVSFGTGRQEEPALAWLPGASAVAWQQVPTPISAPEIRLRLRGPDGAPTMPDLIMPQPLRGSLSSPSLAANGQRLLLVARNDLSSAPGADPVDPDDVAGVFIENGVVIGTPFTIAGGPGSQRAARVTAWQTGFCVVWREELNSGTTESLSRIRCTLLDRNGVPIAPAGLTLATSNQELSSPAVAAEGTSLAIVWRRHLWEGSSVEGAILRGSSPNIQFVTTIFPAAQNARNPDVVVVSDGMSPLFTGRLRLPNGGNTIGLALMRPFSTSQPLYEIQRPGREPALASLGSDQVAVLWLDRLHGPDATEIWMATRGADGVVSVPQMVISGKFNRDTLVVRGDGRGRIQLAVLSTEVGNEGIRVFIFAPGVSAVPDLHLVRLVDPRTSGFTSDLAFRWRQSVLFPARVETVETSATLTHWQNVPGDLGEVTETSGFFDPHATFRTLSLFPNLQPPKPFYRLRALLAE